MMQYYDYGHTRTPQAELCAFFSVELPWAFGIRAPNAGALLPTPWWDKITFPRRRRRRPRPEVLARRRFSL